MDAPTERGLLDTNLVIQLSHVDPHDLPSEPMVSVVTIAELSVGPLVTDDEAERSARLAHLQQAEADLDPIVRQCCGMCLRPGRRRSPPPRTQTRCPSL